MARKFGMIGVLLASSAALGIVPTAAERSRGRLMRAPDHRSGPAWFYGPDGEEAVFEPNEEIPDGWQDHPSKVITPAKTGSAPVGGGIKGGAAGVSDSAAAKAKEGRGPAAPGNQSNTLDAAGWPWTADLHASTQSLTREGLWRMKVGVSRPAPKEGYPKPPLDL